MIKPRYHKPKLSFKEHDPATGRGTAQLYYTFTPEEFEKEIEEVFKHSSRAYSEYVDCRSGEEVFEKLWRHYKAQREYVPVRKK